MVDPYAPPRERRKKKRPDRTKSSSSSSSFVSAAALAQGLIVATVAFEILTLIGLPIFIAALVRLAAVITALIWVYEAASTVRYRPGVTISPAMSIVWFFIPFANFVLPYRALAQVHRACTNRRDGPFTPCITMWQVLFALDGVARIGTKFTGSDSWNLAERGIFIASLGAVFGTIRAIEPDLQRFRKKKRDRT